MTTHPASGGSASLTAKAIVERLRTLHGQAWCFIEGVTEPAGWDMPPADEPEQWLDMLTRTPSPYTSTLVDGRTVLHPRDAVWNERVPGNRIEDSRLQAARAYVEVLRQSFSDLGDLIPPLMKGDPRAPLYASIVIVRGGGSVLQGLVDLLGSDPRLVFTIERVADAHRMLHFALLGQVREAS
jgi:hypothetical protein